MLRPVEVLALVVSASLLWWVLTLATTQHLAVTPIHLFPGY